ncbi:MAG: hypothetical protein II234_03520, partial [Clostridia bacterium]|nr:hypothetical protein [Clostridia bacterium]
MKIFEIVIFDWYKEIEYARIAVQCETYGEMMSIAEKKCQEIMEHISWMISAGTIRRCINMANYYVAKSYQEWDKIGDVYESNGRMYLKVRNPKGTEKEVRAYSETEYRRLYKEAPCGNGAQPSVKVKAPAGPVVKNILGFQEGYIWIFKGDLERAEYWFEQTPECRYHVTFGWYIVSTDSVPFDIPSCIESVQLPWGKVGNTDGTLLPKGIIEAVLNEIRF